MPDLSSFPITQRRPASYPDRLQLYAAPTPNGVKVSIMLEETGLAYEPREWIVDDYSIADIATLGRVNALVESYAAGDILGLSDYSNIQAWLGRGLARPAVPRGLHIPARPA